MTAGLVIAFSTFKKFGPCLYTVAVIGRTERLRAQHHTRTIPPKKLGQLAVKAAEPRYGKLGPPRPDWPFLPYGVLTARLSVLGLSTNDERHYDLEATTEVLASDNTAVSKEPYRLRGAAINEILPLGIIQQLPIKEGTYRLRVTLHDVRSDDRTEWGQQFTRLPTAPALVAAVLYRDADAKVPSPASARVGENSSWRRDSSASIAHAIASTRRSKCRSWMQKGKPMLDHPESAALMTADPAIVRDADVVTFVVAVPDHFGFPGAPPTVGGHPRSLTIVPSKPVECSEAG